MSAPQSLGARLRGFARHSGSRPGDGSEHGATAGPDSTGSAASSASSESSASLAVQVAELSERVALLTETQAELAEELHDARSQGRRAAELGDLVVELLVSEASRRDPDFQQIVARYLEG